MEYENGAVSLIIIFTHAMTYGMIHLMVEELKADHAKQNAQITLLAENERHRIGHPDSSPHHAQCQGTWLINLLGQVERSVSRSKLLVKSPCTKLRERIQRE